MPLFMESFLTTRLVQFNKRETAAVIGVDFQITRPRLQVVAWFADSLDLPSLDPYEPKYRGDKSTMFV